ncbi:MAG: gamma-glutamyl-gamma-aminobutyrate hydrolase family protein [Devosiaceae bacterium]
MSASNPLVLVSSDMRQLHGFTWHAAIDTYLRSAFTVAGLTPVIVPSFGTTIINDALLGAASGVLVTGSRSNVHPGLYGQEETPAHEPYDRARDATTLPLIHAALDRGLPLLAICRGHQELNVALGGTIDTEIQEQEGRRDHRGGDPEAPHEKRFDHNHTVSITPGGLLAGILGTEGVQVNSVHRQAIATLANGLTIEATANDGTIEAISVRDAKSFALGVQWHPEYWASLSGEADAPSTKIFEAFGDAARAFGGQTA